MSNKVEQATYSHGHHPSVISTHARRTAADSAAFLLPHLAPHNRILDLGCGPGTITADLATYVPDGSIIGIDAVESILAQARSLASSRNLSNITFQTGDANNLPFKDGEFDVVYCHQLLQHVKDPVGVLREMRRVCKSGGIVAAREADYSSFAWFPEPTGGEFRDWINMYQRVARANGGEPNAGRHMPLWTRLAGWSSEQVTMSWSSWCFTKEKARSWADSWVGRAVHSDMAKSWVSMGFGREEELVKISEAWRKWGDGGYGEDLIMVVGNGEVICRC
ncbi:hypothetical protein H2198_000027 [Neophaeococcomyces mojaviensis]|uniref:Uncharacterized protein n=1 Tax=Neophaeococcomyces mojaviensis TaxID=3383035 RepID=A0ACC3AL85_9EURO|nr:hypothetical protein H2198_000027 [Knufia sp. JES_112]